MYYNEQLVKVCLWYHLCLNVFLLMFQNTESDEVFRTADRSPLCSVRLVGKNILWFVTCVAFCLLNYCCELFCFLFIIPPVTKCSCIFSAIQQKQENWWKNKRKLWFVSNLFPSSTALLHLEIFPSCYIIFSPKSAVSLW